MPDHLLHPILVTNSGLGSPRTGTDLSLMSNMKAVLVIICGQPLDHFFTPRNLYGTVIGGRTQLVIPYVQAL